jgi:hypothetical protein
MISKWSGTIEGKDLRIVLNTIISELEEVIVF